MLDPIILSIVRESHDLHDIVKKTQKESIIFHFLKRAYTVSSKKEVELKCVRHGFIFGPLETITKITNTDIILSPRNILVCSQVPPRESFFTAGDKKLLDEHMSLKIIYHEHISNGFQIILPSRIGVTNRLNGPSHKQRRSRLTRQSCFWVRRISKINKGQFPAPFTGAKIGWLDIYMNLTRLLIEFTRQL